MAPNLDFEFAYTDGPIIDLRLINPATANSAISHATFDTGADISLFDESLARQLRLDLEGSEQMTILGVGGGEIIARISRVELMLLDELELSVSVTSDVAFAPIRGLGTGNLIGLNVLEHFDFGLSHRERVGYLGRAS